MRSAKCERRKTSGQQGPERPRSVAQVSKPAGRKQRQPTWKSAIRQVWKPALPLLLCLWAVPALAQPRPYIGFVYPAGGQQGTQVAIRLGGQGLDGVNGVLVTGSGVSARITEYYWRMNFQELQLLNEQARLLRRMTRSAAGRAELKAAEPPGMASEQMAMIASGTNHDATTAMDAEAVHALLTKLEARTQAFVASPASDALASLVTVEFDIAPDAPPGAREVRLVTARGVSNPMPFYVGQLPEFSRKPMLTATRPVLGKEAEALAHRAPGDEEERITLPCTVNGQIGIGQVNRYRFEARRGQRLVFTTLGRQLVPFMADAVPGWFQPVLAVYDASGREVAYDDDYRFKPDPTLCYVVPKDGEYTFTIRDSIYRGREDFVYRITVGELPFITSIFPLGARAGSPFKPRLQGWNLEGAELLPLPEVDAPGFGSLAVARKGFISSPVPFARDTLPEAFEREPNNTLAAAQRVSLPVIINGRINKPDDWDVFAFSGKSNETLVAEVAARRLDSPLDSLLKLTDSSGRLLAFNDDHEDLTAGLNTHAADSYLKARLPADGTYYVHIGDTAQQGGEAYGYRLRLSRPQPGFDLRVVPSSLSIRAKGAAALSVYVQRHDGFAAPIKVTLQDPPPGFMAYPLTLSGTQTVARLAIRTKLTSTEQPVSLTVVGMAKIGGRELSRQAVPAEDRMQAFLWRQLVPAQDLKVLVFDPAYEPPPKRVAPELPPGMVAAWTNSVAAATLQGATNSLGGTNTLAAAKKPKFSKQQVAYRLRQLKRLYEEGLLTDGFYLEKVAECQAAE